MLYFALTGAFVLVWCLGVLFGLRAVGCTL